MVILARVGYAALWFFLGVILTVGVLAYLYSRPRMVTVSQDSGYQVVAGHDQAAYTLSYTIPTHMVVGDVADIREHIQNLHLVFGSKMTGKLFNPIVKYRLDTTPACSAKVTAELARLFPTTFPEHGKTTDFAWLLTAEKPGQCALTFDTRVPDARFGNVQPVIIPIYERFSPAEEVTLIVGIFGAIGIIVAAVVTARGAVRAARIARGLRP